MFSLSDSIKFHGFAIRSVHKKTLAPLFNDENLVVSFTRMYSNSNQKYSLREHLLDDIVYVTTVCSTFFLHF